MGGNSNTIEIGRGRQAAISTTNGGQCRKLIYVSLVSLALIAVIGAAVYFFWVKESSAEETDAIEAKRQLKLEDLLSGTYRARGNNATWISNSELLFRDRKSAIVKYNVETNTSTTLANDTIPEVRRAITFKLSSDGKYLLLGHSFQKIYRHSGTALYDILDVETKKVTPLAKAPLLLAEWSPVGNSIAYVQSNNIYYKPNAVDEPIQLTLDGNFNIYNGICDWVYEEEVFSTKKAIWFSIDGNRLAFIRFDDTAVKVVNIPVYGTPGINPLQYPEALSISYPKIGTTNPTALLHSIDLSSLSGDGKAEVVQVPTPPALKDKEYIIDVVAWANSKTLLSGYMNRVQNEAYIQTCEGSACKQLYSLKSTTGWLELRNAPIFNADGSEFVYIASQPQANSDSFSHLTLVSLIDGTQTPLTHGNFVVTKVLAWDTDSNVVFYAANDENATQISNVYAVNATRKTGAKREHSCLTCDIEVDGIHQSHFIADISPKWNRAILTSSGPSVDRVNVVQFDLTRPVSFTHLATWEDNGPVEQLIRNTSLPVTRFLSIGLDSGFDAAIKLRVPPNADLSGETKYPMLIDVYGGPNSYSSRGWFSLGFGEFMSASHSYVYAQIDGRGSGNRGDELLHTIYRAMGTVEIEDQIEVAKKLPKHLPFIDADRIGIWGWSYGGYAAGMALAKDNENVLKCAASVAPVTDWAFYDTIYTERYMGLPVGDNELGYNRSSLLNYADNFRNKTYLLMHGTLDDNVHLQQAMALSRSLELRDIPFEQIIYPEEDHSMANVRPHLYHAIEKFFVKCLSRK